MSIFSDEQKEEFKKVLQDRAATRPCPRCGNASFFLLDGHLSPTIQANLTKSILGGKNVPVIVLICDRCGFLSQHALGVLGLLPKEAQLASEEDQGGDANE